MQPQQRVQLTIRGLVQGVGFRPHVYRVAIACGVTGWVRNEAAMVLVEVQGPATNLQLFRDRLVAELPELARIDSITEQPLTCIDDQSTFEILSSRGTPTDSGLIPADLAPCPDCLAELFDPTNHRYRYPFINCVACGPRFTIMFGLPYDRPRTTMQAFAMCELCHAEYTDPLNRRYHAQPIACPTCGPRLWFSRTDALAMEQTGQSALRCVRESIAAGETVAIKGIGGFHLVCDATNAAAVARLRARKQRPEKPLAIMLSSIEQVRLVAECSPQEQALLESRQRPIVLLNRRNEVDCALAPNLAPDNPRLGIMLPYSPLHYLLMEHAPPLVMTSGNLSDEPIVWDNGQAIERLSGLVDAFLFHDRPIHAVCDDSVFAVSPRGMPIPMRRSRGYAPMPIALPYTDGLGSVLAVGGELKVTFCLAASDYAFQSQHIGDMENLETVAALERNVDTLQSMLNIQPQAIAVDMHPGYLSTQWASARSAAQQITCIPVQHHHAHLAALACEHHWSAADPLVGICLDGTGYGSDGSIWGGEVLRLCGPRFERLAHLVPMPLPGGDAAIRNPYRIALAYLHAAGIAWSDDLPCVRASSPAELRILEQQLTRRFNCPNNSSMGRLFDAVSALIGLRSRVSYEAQAAIELENQAAIALHSGQHLQGQPYRFQWTNASCTADFQPILHAIVQDLHSQVPVPHMALKFHAAVAELIAAWAVQYRSASTANGIGLTGGVFQNGLLLDLAVSKLESLGCLPLIHRVVPCNDAGISLGQAWITLARHVR